MGVCSGQIKGDPDIAGKGVVVALFTNAGIAMLLSLSLWVYLWPVTGPRSITNMDRPGTAPPWAKAVGSILMTQGDVQLIAGLSIMLASLVNMYRDNETPLYHIFIARGLADVTLSGYTAAIIYVYPTEHNWTARLVLIVICVGIWEWWSYLALERFDRWNWETPHCLENDSIIGGDYVVWIKFSMVWMPAGYLPLVLSFSKKTKGVVVVFEEAITKWPYQAFQGLEGFFGAVRNSNGFIKSFKHLLFASTMSVASIFLWAFALFLPACWALNPLQSLLSFVWDVYDIAVARAANSHIVVANPAYRDGKSFQNNTNPEDDWGFGQILPLAMLLLPILTFMDLVSGKHSKLKRCKSTYSVNMCSSFEKKSQKRLTDAESIQQPAGIAKQHPT